jgi:uncharacterized membrane protein
MVRADTSAIEGDESPASAGDNSVGRLLALSDGVFAIAMTLLALELRLPDLGQHVSDSELRHALGDQWQSYLSFVISFYVVSSYWSSHRRAMRTVVTLPAGLVGSTLTLLLLVAAMPFPASVLGNYGSEPSALVFYSAFNIAAHLALLRLLARIPGDAVTAQQREALWANIIVFLVCIPGAYALGRHGPWLLLLLIVSGWLSQLRRRHA